jgi:hypothetical protein
MKNRKVTKPAKAKKAPKAVEPSSVQGVSDALEQQARQQDAKLRLFQTRTAGRLHEVRRELDILRERVREVHEEYGRTTNAMRELSRRFESGTNLPNERLEAVERAHAVDSVNVLKRLAQAEAYCAALSERISLNEKAARQAAAEARKPEVSVAATVLKKPRKTYGGTR